MTCPAVLPSSSKLYFKNPDKGDLGTYSVSVSDTDGVSSSFALDEEGNVGGSVTEHAGGLGRGHGR